MKLGIKLRLDVCLLTLVELASGNSLPPLFAPHQPSHLLGEVLQQGLGIDVLGQLHVEVVAPFAPFVKVSSAGIIDVVLH